LVNEKGASAHTISAYRDTFRLLLTFAQQQTGTPPSKLQIENLDAPLIAAFLDHLEHDRRNSPRTLRERRCGGHDDRQAFVVPSRSGLRSAWDLPGSSQGRRLRPRREYLMWRLMPTSSSGQTTIASSADRMGLRVLACSK